MALQFEPYLQMVEDHLPELLHRGPLGGRVEGGGGGALPPGLHLTPQIITRSLLHLAFNYPLQVSPAPRVHLEEFNQRVQQLLYPQEAQRGAMKT